MRLSNGTIITFGNDYLGPAILVEGAPTLRVETGSPAFSRWHRPGESHGSTGVWRPTKGATLEQLHKECPDVYLETIRKGLGAIPCEGLHPALENGFASEAARIHPTIDPSAYASFERLVASISSEYGFTETSERLKETAPFCDDAGPNIIALVDGSPVMLPETSPVFLSPRHWLRAVWNVNNRMMGPLMFDEVPDERRILLDGVNLLPEEGTPETHGLYYFLMARFVLAFDAESADPTASCLLEFIRLYEKGIRVLEGR